MNLYHSISDAAAALERPVVAIGNFDGVHLGHRTVLGRALDLAERRSVDSAAMTFEPHPVRFFRPDVPEFRLTTLPQKARLIADLGIDGVLALEFDADLASRSPEQFVDDILHHGLGVSCVVVGEDFRFGKGRAGDVNALQRLAAERGFDVETVGPVSLDAEVVSSTRIRAAIRDGNFDVVRTLLGRDYAIEGEVVHGDARGRELGYPTANIASENPLLPPDGIYATRIHDPAYGELLAAAYIGSRPTFAEADRAIEAFVLDADQIDLYDHHVSLTFCAFIRPDQKFDSADELVEQIGADVAAIRTHFGVD